MNMLHKNDIVKLRDSVFEDLNGHLWYDVSGYLFHTE